MREKESRAVVLDDGESRLKGPYSVIPTLRSPCCVFHLLPCSTGSGCDFPKLPWVQTALWGGGAGAGKASVIGETGPPPRLKPPAATAASR